MQFIDLAAQYQHLKDRIDTRIQTVLKHGKYIMGPEVAELEEQLASYVNVKHAITCANGTDALQLAMMAMNIGKDDAVFCPTFTFFATAEVPALTGATPIFVDSEKSTFNICTIDLERRIKSVIADGFLTPKAIISVDLFGLPANYVELKKVAQKYDLLLIEDAAQGFGGTINGQKAGSFGDISTTSFFPAKPLGCYGDGGAIFTNNDEYAQLLRSYRVHGQGSDKYDNIRIGLNSRLDTIQAAILLEKLAEFPKELMKRNQIANTYNKVFSGSFKTPKLPQGYTSSWAQYTIVDTNRDRIMSHCQAHSIPTMVYYRTCMHQQTAFKHLVQTNNFMVSEKLSQQVFSLPMHPYMEQAQITEIQQILASYTALPPE